MEFIYYFRTEIIAQYKNWYHFAFFINDKLNDILIVKDTEGIL
jgi:hypothetical protein